MGRKRSASAGLPASTMTSRIKPLWPVTRLSLCPYRTSRAPPAFALGHAHIWQQPKSPSPPLGAERVGVRWGSPRGRNGGTAHLILPPLPRRAPPSPPASGRRGARARDRMAASRTCVHTLAHPRGEGGGPRQREGEGLKATRPAGYQD